MTWPLKEVLIEEVIGNPRSFIIWAVGKYDTDGRIHAVTRDGARISIGDDCRIEHRRHKRAIPVNFTVSQLWAAWKNLIAEKEAR